MLEFLIILALGNAGLLHVAHKWKLWQLLRLKPCEFCLCFWVSWGVFTVWALHGGLYWLLPPFLGLGSAVLSKYVLDRINYEGN
jgi:hypothetical protein